VDAKCTQSDAPYQVITQKNVPAEAVEKIDLNQADADTLDALPGIGSSLAGRIVEYREKNGPFTQIEELCEVSGIGEKTLNNIRDYIEVKEVEP